MVLTKLLSDGFPSVRRQIELKIKNASKIMLGSNTISKWLILRCTTSRSRSLLTPPWPTYEPLQMKFFNRLAPNGRERQFLTHSNHFGTHLDGPMHFDTAGRDIASLELTSSARRRRGRPFDQAEDFGIYTPEDIENRAEVKWASPYHQHRAPYLRLGFPDRGRAPQHAGHPAPRDSSSGCGTRRSAGSRGLRRRTNR